MLSTMQSNVICLWQPSELHSVNKFVYSTSLVQSPNEDRLMCAMTAWANRGIKSQNLGGQDASHHKPLFSGSSMKTKREGKPCTQQLPSLVSVVGSKPFSLSWVLSPFRDSSCLYGALPFVALPLYYPAGSFLSLIKSLGGSGSSLLPSKLAEESNTVHSDPGLYHSGNYIS